MIRKQVNFAQTFVFFLNLAFTYFCRLVWENNKARHAGETKKLSNKWLM
jgi:hypothetical protein